jgi:hypothetical protein
MSIATDPIASELREAVRRLLLPIEASREEVMLVAVRAQLLASGVAGEDHPAWIRLESDRWREKGTRSRLLTTIIKLALREGHSDAELGNKLSDIYLDLHRDLQSKYKISHPEASLLLSYAGLMNRFAVAEHMSAARIGVALSGEQTGGVFTWRRIQDILRKLKIVPELNGVAVESLFQSDVELEQTLLLDADVQASILIVDELAQRLGFPDDMRALLSQLDPNKSGVAAAYLQIIYFVCVVAEFYDHPPPVVYEFAPRGEVAQWLFGRVRHRLARAGNPVLNNVKAVNRLDRNWAESREGTVDFSQAESLARILLGLERMGFLARRELALWLRLLVHRLIRVGEAPRSLLSGGLGQSDLLAVLGKIATNETNTNGIIEQRVVDALSSLIHAERDGWRSRGHGDSVNATNLSRKKVGDCDYQRASTREVVAYEAHAGKLTDVYIDEHVRSLERVLEQRVDELEAIAEPQDWQVVVVFVAHSAAAKLPRNETICGIKIRIEYLSFPEFVRSFFEGPDVSLELTAAFDQLVIAPLNQHQTPEAVRIGLHDLLGSK